MKSQTPQVACFFSGGEELEQILLRSFRLYLSRALAERHGGAAPSR